MKTHRAASNSLKLSSWNAAQDTRLRCAELLSEPHQETGREQMGSSSSYAKANFSECLPVYWDAAALKETRAGGDDGVRSVRLAAFNQWVSPNEESHPAVTLLELVYLHASIKRASKRSLAPSDGSEAH